MDDKDEKKKIKQYSKGYTIHVTRSEAQVVDSKLSYYTRDLSPSPRKSTSSTKIQTRIRSKSKIEEELEEKITKAIKNQKDFDVVIQDLGINPFIKKEKKSKK